MPTRRVLEELAVAVASVGAITVLLRLVRLAVWDSSFSMAYLVAVLAVAVAYGSRASILAAVAAFLAFDLFFIEPHLRLTVADPAEWVSLLVLLASGIVTGQLAEVARRREVQAAAREREARVLFDVVRLVNENELDDALRSVASRLQHEFNAEAVLIRIDASAGPIRVGVGSADALDFARTAAAEAGRVLQTDGDRQRWVRVRPAGGVQRPGRGDFEHRSVRVTSEGHELGRIVVVLRPGQPSYGTADDRLLVAAGSQLGRATERQQLRAAATEAEVLRRTDELRAAMLNAVSHDLRTPLASIVAAAESLRSRDIEWSPEERQEFVEDIASEARRVDQMVSHLLDLSRIEAGALRIDAQWHDLASVVGDVAGRIQKEARDHHIVLAMPSELPLLQFDAVAIGEVLTNLIENAVRYTPAGSTITVGASVAGQAVEVEVRDDGPGLSDEARAHLFEPFGRGRRGRARTQGSGLGLAVARGLVQAHQGSISGENDPLGGARFRFTLPVTAPPPEVASRTSSEGV